MFPLISVCNVIIISLTLRFYVKIRILHSGLMNVRLSVHCSLKRTERRDDNSVRLPVRLSVQHLHIIFLKYSYGPEWNPMLFFATVVTLTKPQCQETNAHYILKYYKGDA